MVVWLHLKHFFDIDTSAFHNGLKHLCSSKLVLEATLWKVVMKCEIVMFFIFLVSFSQNGHFWGCKILSRKCPVNLIFSVVAFCKSTSHIPANIPHPEHSTSRTSHIPNNPHHKHPTSPTTHIPNIPYHQHSTSWTPHIQHLGTT